jgi:hypothetical protein
MWQPLRRAAAYAAGLIACNRRQGGSARLGAAAPESDNANPVTGAFFSEVVRLWARCSFP